MQSINQLLQAVAPVRERLLAHPVYQRMTGLDEVKVLMRYHAFAVWDFMSLVKALQGQLTCMDLPWKPVGTAEIRYLINEIVLGEESDTHPEGGYVSHFELYLKAMREIGLETEEFEGYVRGFHWGDPETWGQGGGELPAEGLAFNRVTFDLIRNSGIHELAAVFTFGREDLIPDMFVRLVETLDKEMPGRVGILKYYLQRHIEVDGDHHKHLAYRMTEIACGTNVALWEEAAVAVTRALEARLALWDAVVAAIDLPETSREPVLLNRF